MVHTSENSRAHSKLSPQALNWLPTDDTLEVADLAGVLVEKIGVLEHAGGSLGGRVASPWPLEGGVCFENSLINIFFAGCLQGCDSAGVFRVRQGKSRAISLERLGRVERRVSYQFEAVLALILIVDGSRRLGLSEDNFGLHDANYRPTSFATV